MVNVRDPDPPHVVHVERFAPGFKPEPAQGEQSTTGEILTLRVAPLQDSMKDMLIVVSRSAPRDLLALPPPG